MTSISLPGENLTAAEILTRIAELEADTEGMTFHQPHQSEWMSLRLELRWRKKEILGCCGHCTVTPNHRWCGLYWHDCETYTPAAATFDLIEYENLLKEVSELCPS